MNPTTSNNKLIGAIIAVIVIIGALWYFSRPLPATEPMTDMASSTASTTMTAASSTKPAATLGTVDYLYTAMTDKKSYTDKEVIKIAVGVINNTDTAKTYTFKDGCMATYAIGGFVASEHTTCLAEPASFTVAPHLAKYVNIAHYPALYTLAPGTYTLRANIIGYPVVSLPITITK